MLLNRHNNINWKCNSIKSDCNNIFNVLISVTGFTPPFAKITNQKSTFKVVIHGSVGKDPSCNAGDEETQVWSLGGEDPLEKEMVTHSSILAWKTPWTEEPGRLQSMGSVRVRHDWATSLSLFTFMHWRRKWQPTPVFLTGESHRRGSLVGCSLWGRTESDVTEVT